MFYLVRFLWGESGNFKYSEKVSEVELWRSRKQKIYIIIYIYINNTLSWIIFLLRHTLFNAFLYNEVLFKHIRLAFNYKVILKNWAKGSRLKAMSQAPSISLSMVEERRPSELWRICCRNTLFLWHSLDTAEDLLYRPLPSCPFPWCSLLNHDCFDFGRHRAVMQFPFYYTEVDHCRFIYR